jgi:5-methylcytosine-specific restriction endonuclease McrA
MKSIDITGKRNIDKIHKVKIPERKNTENWTFDESYFTYYKQIQLINSLFLEQGLDQELEQKTIVKREINKKINGYKAQDIQKELLDLKQLISLEQTIEKLMVSKLKCFYCKETCELLYKNVFANKQWTLDRIDNEHGHNYDNVVICCLECNVKRGDMDSGRFKRGKDIKIVRKLF